MSHKLEGWRERLNASGLPVFARTVREISHIATSADASAKDLSRVVSRDAAMTARLIHISNSSLFNVQGSAIETVSAAVVRLGFDAVRDLAVSVSVIDEMMKGKCHDRLAQVMAHGFHAAVHARSFAAYLDVGGSGELFVATLLKEVGHMAFWSRDGDEADALSRALASGVGKREAERQVLGFEIDTLSALLCKDWSLGELARKSHGASYANEKAVVCINLAHELATQVERDGWEGDETKVLIAEIADRLSIDKESLEEDVRKNVKDAAAIAERFGVAPIEKEPPQATAHKTKEVVPSAAVSATVKVERDPSVALHHLGLIAEALENGEGRDGLMRLLVQSTYVSLGGELCYFALATPQHDSLVARYACGDEAILGQVVAVDSDSPLGEAFGDRKIRDIVAPTEPPLHRGGSALAAGVVIGGRPIGVLYVERSQPFYGYDRSTFRHFAQQVALILTQAE